MKKLYTFIAAVALTATAYSQTQRFVLVEEFTGETCPPCAGQNPGFNAIMDANASKGIALKYQNQIPSAGPNFFAYNTADIATRRTFYNNTYSPEGFQDGNTWTDVIGLYTATMLNTQYAVPSPFSMAVSHTLSAANDSIHATVVVTAAQTVNNSNLKLQVAIAEQEVFGYTSPNGEDEYSNVMRKMLPDGNGTAIQAAWTNGQSMTYNLSWKIAASPTAYPGPLPAKLRVIAFIQDATTKNVLQAGADQNLVTADAGLNAVTNVPSITCGTTITPSVEITNEASGTMTTLDIQYALDGGATQTFAWTGSLATGASTTAVLPAITVTGTGAHSLVVTLANPNGLADQVPTNSTKTVIFATPTSVATISQDFTSTTFPPANWLIENPDNSYTWTRSTSGSGSARVNFYNSPAGQSDIMNIVEGLDLTTVNNAALTFDLAHQQYSPAESDELSVDGSTDCGATWTTLWNKAGATLATVSGFETGAFAPTAGEWRNESVNLSGYFGQASVLLRFNGISDYGNNVFVDNVNLGTATGLPLGAFENAVAVFPNPAKDILNVSVGLDIEQTVDFILMDLNGKSITQQQAIGSTFTESISLKDIAAGIYMLKVKIDGFETVKKVVVE